MISSFASLAQGHAAGTGRVGTQGIPCFRTRYGRGAKEIKVFSRRETHADQVSFRDHPQHLDCVTKQIRMPHQSDEGHGLKNAIVAGQ